MIMLSQRGSGEQMTSQGRILHSNVRNKAFKIYILSNVLGRATLFGGWAQKLGQNELK